jgi:hydrophobic/amphiphilic exporter-1 (mainly G- bacteria), HAE1 family
MWISSFAIKNPIVTVAVMLALVVFGFISLLLLQTDEFPDVDPPVVAISIPYPGASPESVEREVISPLEDAFAAIDGVDKIHSTAFDNYGIIIIEFLFSKDLQEATTDVRDKISGARQDLPLEMEEPVVARFDFADFPIISLTLSSDQLSPADLTKIADPGIVGDLQGVHGVAQVKLVGGVEPELTVELHPHALQAAQVSVDQVVQALQSSNLAAPVGALTTELKERTIRLQGRLEDPAQFEAITVAGANGKLVRLGDVATVKAGTEEQRSLALFDTKQAVGIDILKADGTSTTAVSKAVNKRIEDIRANLPEGAELTIVADAGERVAHSVEDVEKTLLQGAALTVFVVFLFLGSWRSTVITGLALPVSVLASFLPVLALGYTLNTMSLLGLSLAIGILVDDAIVVRENIVRHMERGKDHYTAAHEGTAEIGLAVAATTFSIVVVFVPVAFMGSVAEQWMGPMALTIAASVLVSLFVSFSLDPMLSAYWADPVLEAGKKRGWLMEIVHRFDVWLEQRTEAYTRMISWSLKHRAAIVFLAIAAFVGALALPATGVIGTSFFPKEDRSELILALELEPGSSLDMTRAKTEEAVRVALKQPGVRYVYSTIGAEGQTIDTAQLYVRLTPKADRDVHADDIAKVIVDEIDRMAGVKAAVFTGFGPEKQISLQLQGPDIEVLAGLAEQIEALVKEVPGASDVGLSTGGQKPELQVELHRDVAASLGISVGQVAMAMRPAFAGIDVGDWVDPQGETRDVRVRFAPESRRNAADLATVPLVLATPEGQKTVPLGTIADIREGRGPAQIQHLDRDRVIAVEANTRDIPMSEVMKGIQEKLDAFPMPPGYGIIQGGDVEAQTEVFGRMGAALVASILLMYLILVIQFGSFLDPISILVSLPLSLIGVMLALLLTGSTVNLMSLIGVTLLMGIVAKNAILLIDFAKWAVEKGVPRQQAIIDAGRTRLRPILMTSVAIVAGMLPVAVGGGEGADFRAPLGRAVIGGVITSTLLSLLVIPTLYDMFSGWRERLARRFFPKRVAAREAKHAAAAHGTPVVVTEGHPAK